MVIYCNNKEVLNVVMSDATCTVSTWSTYWGKDVEKMKFDSSLDSASDYYRAGEKTVVYLIIIR